MTIDSEETGRTTVLRTGPPCARTAQSSILCSTVVVVSDKVSAPPPNQHTAGKAISSPAAVTHSNLVLRNEAS